MQTIFDFITHTPLYVYFIFLYLLRVGMRSCKDQIVSIYKPATLVAIFTYLAFGTISKLNLNLPYYILLSSTLLLFGSMGWVLMASKNILVDKKSKLLRLPGSWITLVIVSLTFSLKYYLGYQIAQDPFFMSEIQAKWLTILTSGFSSGLLLGRFFNYLYRFRVEPHTELSTAGVITS